MQKAIVVATALPISLLYIQYIQYHPFNVKCWLFFSKLQYRHHTPPVQQMHNKEVFEQKVKYQKVHGTI